jgi:hypothetical protein
LEETCHNATCHFVHHRSHVTWPGIKPRPPLWDAILSEGDSRDATHTTHLFRLKWQWHPLGTGTALKIKNELGSDVAPCYVIPSNLFVHTDIIHSYPHMHAWKLIFISNLISVHFINTEYFFDIIIFFGLLSLFKRHKRRLRRSSCWMLPTFFFSFSVLALLYSRKVDNYFFPELCAVKLP